MNNDKANGPCRECQANRGQLHAFFCPLEVCPFCGTQLASCDCIHKALNLNAEESRIVDEYVDDSVEPLKSIVRRWEEALEQKGRVPW